MKSKQKLMAAGWTLAALLCVGVQAEVRLPMP